MKFPALIIFPVLASCVATSFYENGKPVIRIEGDCKGATFHRDASGAITFSGDLTHSTIIAAHGKVTSDVLLHASPVIVASGLPGLIH